MKKVIIIGAGASGVYLSILLMKKLYGEIEVIVLEQNSSPLKKLLSTGNGRCNLSNKDMNIKYFKSDDLNKVNNIISSYNLKQQFEKLGIMSIYYGNLLYPRSEQALSIKNILINEAENNGVRFIYDTEVKEIQVSSKYILRTNKDTYKADYVIFAMGSEAGKLSGINTSRYDLLKQLGLKVVKTTPSLVSVYTKPVLKQLKGVKVKGTFTLLKNNKPVHKEKGELLFTDYGISGIAIMQLSSYIEEGQEYEISMDIFDDYTKEELTEMITQRLNMNLEHFYDGLVNSKLSHYLETLNIKDKQSIIKLLKDYRLKITGLREKEYAQVMKGGLHLSEVNEDLSIIKYPHLYAIGEILNVAGMCGGYNLHFAFSCSYRVAEAIERDLNVKNK